MDKLEAVKRYYGKMLSDDKFYQRFYDNFLVSHPEVPKRFEGVDLVNQHKLLRHGVNLMIMFADKNLAGDMGLERIRKTHSPSHMGIPGFLYDHWKASFLKTLDQLDPNLDQDVREGWEELIDMGIEKIRTPVSAYNN